MAERDVRERDILVASNEYAYVQDLTKGDIVLYVGPTKISLSNTERLVDFERDRFVPVREEGRGVRPFLSATSSQYIVLENPPKDPGVRAVKGSNSAVELLTGRRVVVPGPATFPLWPGQKAEVRGGHALYEDDYLRVRVYDQVEGDASAIGTERIVRGSEVSFYVPKTGLEVVPDGAGYVRSAVTLTDGQYCILRGTQNRRRYVRGPAVVFPEPWEQFVEDDGGSKVFPAVPLRRDRGLHLRAVKAFEAEAGGPLPEGRYKPGQEIFLQGADGFFFPSDALTVMGEVQAIPLAEKEGIYVRNVATGRVDTVVGPKNFLPDPTEVEVVHRDLPEDVQRRYGLGGHGRGRAVSVYVPPSYAVLVTARAKREVVRGPQVRILDFDEELEVLTLSTGKPKRDDALLATCFLLTNGNKVSDVVRLTTSDHVALDVRLSYRVSFATAEEERWFNVKNYVALLCDHLGSIARAAVRGVGIDALHGRSAEILRSAILGGRQEDGKRTGRTFEENGMVVYDVEVLDVKILDPDVEALLASAQRSAIRGEVWRKQEELRLVNERLRETVNQGVYEAQLEALAKEVQLETGRRSLSLAKADAEVEVLRATRVGNARSVAEAGEIESVATAEARRREATLEKERLEAQTRAFEAQMAALAPELIATLKMLGNRQAAAELTRNLAPLAILGGESVGEVAERLLKSLPIGTADAPR